MNANPPNDAAEGLEVLPSSGGAVIKLSPLALHRMQLAFRRGQLTFVALAPIMDELRKSLEGLTATIQPDATGMRLDPAFSEAEEDHA